MRTRLRTQAGFFKAVAGMAGLCFFMISCGSGGGGLDIGNGNSDCDPSPVSGTLFNSQIKSKDERAILRVSNFPTPIAAQISVNCNQSPDQVGRAYEIELSQTSSQVELEISYLDGDITGVDENKLLLGQYDPLALAWDDEITADFQTDRNKVVLAGPQNRLYAIHTPAEGGGGNPPTTPTNVRASVPNSSVCEILISWDQSTDPENDISSYSVSRSGIHIGDVTVSGTAPQCAPGTRCTFQDNGTINPHPIQGTTYTYTVRAVDNLGHQSDEGIGILPVTAPSACPAQ